MALSAQDKILYVANKLGLSTLGNMQGSTGAVYDVDTDISGQIFSSASRHQNPGVTNLTENQFEVNEALLVENISFYVKNTAGATLNFQRTYGSNAVIVFDLIIGNKRTMKDTPVFAAGSPYTFANTANTRVTLAEGNANYIFTTTSSVYGRRWYFDSAASSMVRRLPHLRCGNWCYYCTLLTILVGLLSVRHSRTS
jgi:hypothetical protein